MESLHNLPQKISKISLTVIAVSGLILSGVPIYATSAPATLSINANFETSGSAEDELAKIQQQLEELKKQKSGILNKLNAEKGSQNKINNQIAYAAAERDLIQNEVDANNLEIKEMQTQEQIISASILATEEVIKKTEAELVKLGLEADEALSQMYLDTITSNTGINLIFANGNTDFVKTGVYQQAVQEDTNNALTSLNDKNNQLQSDKSKLLEDQNKILENKQAIEAKSGELIKRQGELQQKITALNALRAASMKSIADQQQIMSSLSEQEKRLLAQYDEVLKKIADDTGSLPNGVLRNKGDVIGVQGKTGFVIGGEHVHFVVYYNGVEQNPCKYLPSGTFGSCGGNGQLGWMLSPSFYYTSAYGPRPIGTGFHHGADFSHPIKNAPVYATHKGYYQRTFEKCPSWASTCNGGGANIAKLCENKNNCNIGFKTLYYHLL